VGSDASFNLKQVPLNLTPLEGWTIPLFRLIKHRVLDVADCNNQVRSAVEFFGTSCAVNSLHDRYNPLGEPPGPFSPAGGQK
jgi:hypothetical protein